MPKNYRGGRGGGTDIPTSSMMAPVTKTRESAAKTAQYDAEFNALRSRFQDKYGWKLDDNLRDQQDWRTVRDSIYGVESVLKDFPGAQQYLAGGGLKSESLSLNTLGDANLGTGQIRLNNSYMRDQRTLGLVMQRTAQEGFHPSGSAAQGVATHETGHLLVTALTRKTGMSYDDTASDIVKTAFRSAPAQAYARSLGIRSNATRQMAGTISQYAIENYHETIAEAVSDWRTNGSQANPFSRVIVRELKNRFK
ncbi:MAG: hypothetical protein E7185_09855 [Erysipelotrichaceae bacterium]|nr:hypothetical protein [Erysipelotrichaceae bacterium]